MARQRHMNLALERLEAYPWHKDMVMLAVCRSRTQSTPRASLRLSGTENRRGVGTWRDGGTWRGAGTWRNVGIWCRCDGLKRLAYPLERYLEETTLTVSPIASSHASLPLTIFHHWNSSGQLSRPWPSWQQQHAK